MGKSRLTHRKHPVGESTTGQEKWWKFCCLNDLKMGWTELSVVYCKEQVQSNAYVL